MALAGVVGHVRAVESLGRSLAHGAFPTGYLLHGPEGVGKRTVALEFLRAYLCGGHGFEACGGCASCRHLGGAPHPDFLALAPEGAHIRIDQIRGELVPFLSLSPQWGRRKAALIDQAEAMTLEAANALLKTLEEPPPGALLVLLTAHPALLPATVVSRCQRIAFGPLRDAEVTEVLVRLGWEPAVAREAALLAEGSPGRALARGGAAWRRKCEEVQALGAALAAGDRGAALAHVEDFRDGREGREEALLGIDILAGWLRRVIRRELGEQTAAAELPGFLAGVDAEEASRLLGRALEVRRAIEGNVNPKLALAGFWLSVAPGAAAGAGRAVQGGGGRR